MSIAPRLRQYLDDQRADYEVVEHKPTKSAMQSAEVCHIPADRIAKGVLLDTGDDYLLAVIPADHRLQLSDLKEELGQRPQLVEETALEQVFNDCEMGAVPAIGSGYGVSTIIDDSLENQPDVYFEAGDHKSLVHMSQREFARLTGAARHGSFSTHWSMMDG
ncbi:aminoacyl-tRNA deacylase [Sphingomonas sp. LaA6.9]|uniref:aminoacyl-tRNA deacylase n=1 Tax=Sphingomonas sp. LaA6.9 TaxID=2919914 RepID=UPI001F4FD352|nr:YbaK/EbsC family protein [Sphingomonas sp. LaA6.9]MCJ8158479.1 YbaK/EbsC family protein [Sphingomonas sp. LaA6.9]